MEDQDAPLPIASQRPAVILIVEDELLLRMTLVDHLGECGFHTLEAGTAQEAITLIEAGAPVDVVLTDVRMPGEMDGFGLARWLRENRPHMTVFVASGYSGKLDLAQELCGKERFFVKPYDLDLIVARIREHLAAGSRSRT
jgi:CheY-like chemotaxis protein